jgi:hypothetical protein
VGQEVEFMKCSLCLIVALVCFVVADLTAPDSFEVEFVTTVNTLGENNSFIVYVERDWAPYGVDHFYTLLQPENHYYDNNGFFRVVSGFVVQVKINPFRFCVSSKHIHDIYSSVGYQW